MATKKLPPSFASIRDIGYHRDRGDGAAKGLYLQVRKATDGGLTRSWLYRFNSPTTGKPRWMGLGPADVIGLAKARDLAREARAMRTTGIDPIEARLTRRDEGRKAALDNITFRDAAARYIKLHEAGWKNPKHRQQWRNTLEQYAFPKLGARPVAALDTAVINDALAPIWSTIPETAARVRGRVQMVAQWVRGGMPLPKQTSTNGENQPALPYEELPAFMADLRGRDGTSARALEFQILTASRPGAVVGARWDEIDLKNRVWTIPASRPGTKLRDRDHRVPLTDRAIEVLGALPREKDNPHIFVGGKAGGPLSDMALNTTIRRMNKDREKAGLPLYVDPRQSNRAAVPHGFRSTFRDWAADRTSYPNHVAEMALAHTVGNKVEAAYRRGDLFDKRQRLMADWARYCEAAPAEAANVTPIREARNA